MKISCLSKPARLVGLLLLLLALMVTPALAQGPEDGDVSIQMADFLQFLWNPAAASVSDGDGTVVTRLNITGAQQIFGATLAIAYDSGIVVPDSVKPGSLLPGTEGVDYLMVVVPGGGGLGCGGDTSFTVNIVYFNPAMTINGSGRLIEITWRSAPSANPGDVATVCLDGTTSQLVDSGGVPSVTPVANTMGTITIDPFNLLKFQIGLEGGKGSGLVQWWAVPDPIFTDVKINGVYPCTVDPAGYCAFNNSAVSPPYTIEVKRIGYLNVKTTFANPADSSSVFLLAGDVNDDNRVDIFDIVLVAGLLGSPVGLDTLSNAADFVPSGTVDIFDLVLVAKNFGRSGPTAGTPPPGTFPF